MKRIFLIVVVAVAGWWAGDAATMPLNGAGTQANPYQIASTSDWNALGQYVTENGDSLLGKYVKVMNDIDFTGVTVTPLGNKTTGFAGTLVGNHCTLSGISFEPTSSFQGIIGQLLRQGEVDDLTMKGDVTTKYNYTGGFFGRINGKASNCNNYLNVTSTMDYVGGFAGFADTAAVFVNCNNYGAITGTKGSIGGFVANGKAGLSFTGCTNYGTITCNATSSYKNTGGLVGYGCATTFVNCDNRGEIVSKKGVFVGGLAGGIQGTGNLVFTNCNNYATITGGSPVGGLLGSTITKTTSKKCAIIADNCHNYGAISSPVKGSHGTGGLFGIMTPGSKVSNCHNEGTVTSAAANYAGGIWGMQGTTTVDTTRIYIDNCYNTADVTNASNYAAGIGSLTSCTHLTNCYNTGNVTALTAAGGLGSCAGNDSYVTNCWNSGDVATTSKANAGGLLSIADYRVYVINSFNTGDVQCATYNAGGLMGKGRVVFTNCYNRGNVSGQKNVGGLIGQGSNNGGSTTIPGATLINCYNAGLISAEIDSLAGNIMGSTAYWSTAKGCAIADCYYITDYYGKVYNSDTIGGTAVTVKELAAMTSMPGDWTYGDAYTYPMILGLENECAQTFAVAVVLADGDTYDNVTTSFTLGEQDAAEWTSSTDSILITDYAFIGGPIDKMSQAVVMTASAADGKFQAPWYLTVNADKAATGIEENELTDRVLTSTMYYDITGTEVTTPAAGNLYIRLNKYNDGTQSASKVRF